MQCSRDSADVENDIEKQVESKSHKISDKKADNGYIKGTEVEFSKKDVESYEDEYDDQSTDNSIDRFKEVGTFNLRHGKNCHKEDTENSEEYSSESKRYVHRY